MNSLPNVLFNTFPYKEGSIDHKTTGEKRISKEKKRIGSRSLETVFNDEIHRTNISSK